MWEEAKVLIQRLYVQAQDKRSFSLIVEVLLLQGKFAAIDGDFQKALKYLDQAQLTAEDKNINLLILKVAVENYGKTVEHLQKLIEKQRRGVE